MGGVACSNCVKVLAKFAKSVSLMLEFRIEDCNYKMIVNVMLSL